VFTPSEKPGVLQDLNGIHVVAQTETGSSFLGDAELITGNRLDSDTESHSLLGFHRESMNTTHSEFLNINLEPILDLLGLVAAAKLDDDTSHALCDMLELSGGLLTVGDLGMLVNGVGWLEVEDLDTGVDFGWVGDGTNSTSVDDVLVLGTGNVGSQPGGILRGGGL